MEATFHILLLSAWVIGVSLFIPPSESSIMPPAAAAAIGYAAGHLLMRAIQAVTKRNY